MMNAWQFDMSDLALDDYPESVRILITGDQGEPDPDLTRLTDSQETRILIAASGSEALDLVKRQDVAVIVLDLGPVDEDGVATVTAFQSQPGTSQVPVIAVVPADTDEGAILRLYEAGAADVLVRPVALSIVQAKIRVLARVFLSRRKSEQRTRERLKSSEAKYKSLFDTSRDGIVFMSLDGHIENANTAYCEMLGYSLNELIFMTDAQHTPAKWLAGDRDILENQVLKRDYSDEYRKELIRKDRTVFPVRVRVWLVRNSKGEPLRLLKQVHDATAQTRLEAQLRQAQKMESIGTLAGGIAHDFNNILGAIIGYAQLARYNLKDHDPAVRDIDHVLTASNRAKDLVKHILGFSRLTEHRMQPVQMHHIVKEALKLIRASLPSTIEIRQNIATTRTTILADPTEIHQVIMNFCTNALHAMEGAGGILEVRLEPVESDAVDMNDHPDLKPGCYLKLMVRDTGCGIDPVHIERIFDPYFTTKKQGTGTGLGLAVVHGIVKNHGGSIHVKSDSGSGTVMTVLFPRLADAAEKAVPAPEALPTGHETILFVDDESALVEIEKNMLQRLGYRVMTESSSVRAFDLFREDPHRFDMVITDMTMPDMTGLDLARRCSSLRPGLPIILCTGYTNKITEGRARAAGIGRLLIKPVEIRELAGAIRSLFDQGQTGESPDLCAVEQKDSL
ncbi:hypothetical protein JCM14469_22960 [Desulfatiferula olefinivorans]